MTRHGTYPIMVYESLIFNTICEKIEKIKFQKTNLSVDKTSPTDQAHFCWSIIIHVKSGSGCLGTTSWITVRRKKFKKAEIIKQRKAMTVFSPSDRRCSIWKLKNYEFLKETWGKFGLLGLFLIVATFPGFFTGGKAKTGSGDRNNEVFCAVSFSFALLKAPPHFTLFTFEETRGGRRRSHYYLDYLCENRGEYSQMAEKWI